MTKPYRMLRARKTLNILPGTQGLMSPHPNRWHNNLHTAVPESAGPHPKNFREHYPNLPAQADNARVQLHLPEKSLAPGTPDQSPCHTSSSIFLTSIKNSPPHQSNEAAYYKA